MVWVQELFRGRSINTDNSRRLTPSESELKKHGLTFGDILFCRSSLKLDGIAFNNVYLGCDRRALFECHLIKLSPEMSVIDPVFLNHQLRLPQFRAILKSKSKTATMTTIDQKSLGSVKVIVPKLSLQTKFSNFVSTLDEQTRTMERYLKDSECLFASLQHRAFNGDL